MHPLQRFNGLSIPNDRHIEHTVRALEDNNSCSITATYATPVRGNVSIFFSVVMAASAGCLPVVIRYIGPETDHSLFSYFLQSPGRLHLITDVISGDRRFQL